jgi:hypothetical protein
MAFFLLMNLFLLNSGVAAELTIIGPCSESPLSKQSLEIFTGDTVGTSTIRQLDNLGIPYLGTERGLHSIYDTPTGSQAIEVVSATEYLAYGWCYSVNGFEPADYPDEFAVSENDSILWWFGYAHFKDGRWIAQCNPSYLRASPQFCP